MKNLILYIIVIFTICSCNDEFENKCFDESGPIVVQTRELPTYDKILTFGVFDYYLVQDTVHYVEIECGENLEPYISTEVINGTLNIEESIRCKWSREYFRPKITLHFIDLSRIKNQETANIISTDTLNLSFLQIFARADLSEYNLTLNVEHFNFIGSHTSTGDFVFNGKCNFLDLIIFGAAKINGLNFKADSAQIEHNAISDIVVGVNNYLTTNITNSGNIYLTEKLPKTLIEENTNTEGKVLLYH